MKDNNGNEVYGCIYKITNLVNNKCYNGKTTENNYEKYINNHFRDALSGKDLKNKKYDNEGRYFYNAIRKYGKHNFKWKILGFCNSKEELDNAEIETIWIFRSFGSDGEKMDSIYGYNLTKGGGGTSGYKHTEEQRKNNSEGHLGQKAWCEGLTKETDIRLLQLSESKKKYKFTEEHCKNISISQKGKISWSKGLTKKDHEGLMRISEAKKGENNPMYDTNHYEIWLEKYGKEVAEEKLKLFCEKQSEAKKGKNNPMYGYKYTEEQKKQKSIQMSGENNPTYGKCYYDFYISKYGEEVAEIKRKERIEKINKTKQRKILKEAEEIYKLYKNGYTIEELCTKFNRSKRVIIKRIKLIEKNI